MHLDQLETILVGTTSLDRMSLIVQSERANVAHQGSTGGNTLVDVKKCDLSSCPTIPLSEKSLAQIQKSLVSLSDICHLIFAILMS